MGLDATVMCNCYAQGLTTPPPVARELIYFNRDGYLSINLPYDGNEELVEAFDRWCEESCAHPNMWYADVRVSNWAGYRLFKWALDRAGWEHFPTLRRELPEGNDGATAARVAALALPELEYFKEQTDLGTGYFLVDTEANEVLAQHVLDYEGVFSSAG